MILIYHLLSLQLTCLLSIWWARNMSVKMNNFSICTFSKCSSKRSNDKKITHSWIFFQQLLSPNHPMTKAQKNCRETSKWSVSEMRGSNLPTWHSSGCDKHKCHGFGSSYPIHLLLSSHSISHFFYPMLLSKLTITNTRASFPSFFLSFWPPFS